MCLLYLYASPDVCRMYGCVASYLFFMEDTAICTYVTGPGKTVLIYTKYSCLYSGMYLLFCMCYPKSVSFIEFLMDFCIYDDILVMIQITNKKLLHFKLIK